MIQKSSGWGIDYITFRTNFKNKNPVQKWILYTSHNVCYVNFIDFELHRSLIL